MIAANGYLILKNGTYMKLPSQRQAAAQLSAAGQEPITGNMVHPHHIAIIMDGNGRWAKSRGLPRTAGHKKGAEALRTILTACRDHDVRCLTVYAFSSENWKRPANEILDLMQLLRLYLQHEIKELHAHDTKLQFIGDRTQLDADIQRIIEEAESLTCNNTSFTLTVALSYGSRQELVRAVRKLASKAAKGELDPQNLTEDDISRELDTSQLPEPDLLIRTGGEQRLSNFLLWQSAYTELYFTPTLWPDFGNKEFGEALEAFAARERRYGNTHD